LLLIGTASSLQGAPLAYITNTGTNTISIIDTETDTVVNTVTVGTSPNGVTINSQGTLLYVGYQSLNTIAVIDIATNQILSVTVLAQRLNTSGGLVSSPAG